MLFFVLLPQLQERLRRLQACVTNAACQTEEALLNVAAPAPLLTELLRPPPEPHSSRPASPCEPIAETAPCESEEAPPEHDEDEPLAREQQRGHAQVSKAPAAEPCGGDLEQRPAPAGRPAAELIPSESVQQQQQAEAAPLPPPPPRGPPPAAEDEERAQEAPAEVPAAPVQSSSQEAAAPPESPARKAARKR